MHGMKEFGRAVKAYERALGSGVKGKVILVEIPDRSEAAFFSIAPLSRAAHNLGAEVTAFVGSEPSKALAVLCETYSLHSDCKKGVKSKGTSALLDFMAAVKKRAKSSEFGRILKPPEIWLTSQKGGFGGDMALCYSAKWLKWRKKNDLFATCRKILREGYALKKNERFGLGFELAPAESQKGIPVSDYLDNFAIAWAMLTSAGQMCKNVSAGASTTKESKLMPMVRVDDLLATIKGCEYEKNINEDVFRKFRKLSGFIHAERLKTADASFGIHGKGYGGRHFFGTTIGYPTPNLKARWQGPGAMLMKLIWHSQALEDKRKPQTRYAITETLPIENFVRTCNINYAKMRARNAEIVRAIGRCEKLFAKGRNVKGGSTDLVLNLRKPDGSKISAIGSDSDVRWKIDRQVLKEKGIASGMYDNFPGGEAFLTPYEITGRAIGDVVINVDMSYVINPEKPIVVEFDKGAYRVVSAPRSILARMRKEWKDSRKLIAIYKRNKSMSRHEIGCYERNFSRTGEFAINTNPKAKLSRYLIENEKIARMMHIALGSGFDSGRETAYHWDFVLNSPRQRMDVYGIDAGGREHWIIRKGKFVA